MQFVSKPGGKKSGVKIKGVKSRGGGGVKSRVTVTALSNQKSYLLATNRNFNLVFFVIYFHNFQFWIFSANGAYKKVIS